MDVHPKILNEYLTKEGISPFGKWLNSLKDIRAKARIRIRLDRLSFGNLGDCKSVGNGVYELRVDYGPGYRVYFGQDGDVIIVLLCGGDKHSQQADIRKAYAYWQDYEERKDE